MEVVVFISHLIGGPLLTFFAHSLLKPKYERKAVIGTMIFIQSLLVLLTLPMRLKAELSINMPITLLVHLLLLIFMFSDPIWKKLLAFLYFYLISILSEALMILIIVYGFGEDINKFIFEPVPFAFASFFVNSSIFFFGSVGIKLFRRIFARDYSDSKTSLTLMSAYFFTQVFNLYILSNLIYKYGANSLILIFSLLASFILSFVFIIIMQRNHAVQIRKEAEGEFAKEQLKLQNQHYQQLRQQYEKMRELKHDFSNHLQTIEALYADKEHAHIRNYINDLSVEMEESLKGFFSGNSSADAVLFYNLELAKELNIDVECKVSFKESLNIPDIDLCSLLSNMLDNAIEGCRSAASKKYIRIQTKYKFGMLAIVVANSCGPLSTENYLSTTKEDKENHGLGTKIIREIAEKHGGTAFFEHKDGVFTCVVDFDVLNKPPSLRA